MLSIFNNGNSVSNPGNGCPIFSSDILLFKQTKLQTIVIVFAKNIIMSVSILEIHRNSLGIPLVQIFLHFLQNII